MSSLAATQADGYYIPPDYYTSGAYEKKSISQHAGSKGHNQYSTNSICRFELPFDGFCTSCDAIVGKGTRFNARKSHVDDYYATRIYEFATTCRACGKCAFTIRTNPKERTFDYVGGIRRKVEEFDTAEAGTHGIIDTEFGNGILRYENGRVDGPGVDDAAVAAVTTASGGSKLGMLERNAVGRRIARTEHDRMTSLLALNSRMVHDSDHNASIRRAFRIDRKAKKRRFGNAATLGLGRGIELLDGAKVEDDEDAMFAKELMHSRRRDSGNNDLDAIIHSNDRLRDVRAGGIFSSIKSSNGISSRASSGTLDLMRKNRRGGVDMKYSHSGGAQIIIRNRRKKASSKEDEKTASIDPQEDQSPSQQPMKPTTIERESRHAIKEGSDALALLSSCYDSD